MKNKRRTATSDGGDPASAATRMHPVEWVVASGAVSDVLQEMNARLRRRRRVRASSGGVLALLLAVFVWHQVDAPERVPAHISAAIVSLPERQVLPDGSIVELKFGARIAVAFTDAMRRVVLTEGEAHFQVASQALPFLVAVKGLEVRALGTAFSVHLDSTGVDVVVTQGVVSVGQSSQIDEAETRGAVLPTLKSEETALAVVEAGNRILVPFAAATIAHAPPVVVPIAATEMAKRLAWRAPRLEFSRTPLTQALTLMRQHAAPGTDVAVTLADPSLGRVEVSGVLRADNLETLLRLLQEEHGILSEHVSAREIILRKAH